MTDRGTPVRRGRRITVALLFACALVIATAGVAFGVSGTVGPADAAELRCADGDGGGPVYVTDSGLELEDNHSAADDGYPTFPDNETVALGEAVNVSFSAPGEATLRLERHDGGGTCLAAVDAASNPITVEPAEGITFTVDGPVDALAVGSGDFVDESVDVSSNASDPFELALLDTGLNEGETVTAEDADLEADVDADGAVRFELGAGERTVSLAVEESSGGIGLPPPPPPAEPASFEFGEATLSATSLEIGEPFAVEVPVANVGDELGSETVILLIDGERVDEATVTLTGGSEETVELTHAFDGEGEFEVTIPDVLTESVSVVDPEPADDTASADDAGDDSTADAGDASTAAETDGGISGFVVALVIGCVLAIAALVFHRTRD